MDLSVPFACTDGGARLRTTVLTAPAVVSTAKALLLPTVAVIFWVPAVLEDDTGTEHVPPVAVVHDLPFGNVAVPSVVKTTRAPTTGAPDAEPSLTVAVAVDALGVDIRTMAGARATATPAGATNSVRTAIAPWVPEVAVMFSGPAVVEATTFTLH